MNFLKEYYIRAQNGQSIETVFKILRPIPSPGTAFLTQKAAEADPVLWSKLTFTQASFCLLLYQSSSMSPYLNVITSDLDAVCTLEEAGNGANVLDVFYNPKMNSK